MKTSRGLWNFALPIIRREVNKRFDVSVENFDFSKIEGPLLVIPNHACAWDPFFIMRLFPDRQLAFVASEHTVRMPWIGKFVEKYVDIIPHKKAGGGTRSTIECLKRLRNGETVFIASEGEQTWDGKSKSVVPSTGKLIKKSGATVMTLNIEGAYLAMPRWADNCRRGKVYVRHVNIYTPEMLADMTPEEINETIDRDLYFNVWDWQRAAGGEGVGGAAHADGGAYVDGGASSSPGMNRYIPKKGGMADGIERLLFMCPSCKKVGTLSSHGDDVSCECGFKVALCDTGFFNPTEPFETVCEWNEWQESELEKALGKRLGKQVDVDGNVQVDVDAATAYDDQVFSDGDVIIVKVENGHDEQELDGGKLSLIREDNELYIRVGGEKEGISGGTCFALSEIENMTMILYNRIVFSAGDVYYEIRPRDMKGRMNLRKYLVAWKKRSGREE